MPYRFRSLNSIFIPPLLAVVFLASTNWLMYRQIRATLIEFITDRKAVNARQAGDRLRYQLQLPITNLEKYARVQRTLDLSFDQTASLLVERKSNKFDIFAFSDFNREGKGRVDLADRPELAAVEQTMLKNQGSINFNFMVDGQSYHASVREVYDDPARSGTQLWLITNIDDAIYPVLAQLRLWVLGSIATQIVVVGLFAIVDIQPLWMLKYFLDRGFLSDLPVWAPNEIKQLRDAIAGYQSEVIEQRQKAISAKDLAQQSEKQAIEAKQLAEKYAEDIQNVTHLFAHDIKGDLLASGKAGEMIEASANSLSEYVEESSEKLDVSNLIESFDFIRRFAKRIIQSTGNAFDVIDQRNRLTNLDEKIDLRHWPIASVLETVKSVGIGQDGQFILKEEYTPGATVLCDMVFFPAVLKNLIRNGFIHNDKDLKKVQLKVWQAPGVVYFKVSDNGVGMPAEYLRRWGMVQGKAAQLGERGGSGLGLYSVRKTMHAHKAEVYVKSQEGQGSSFALRLVGGPP